MTTHDDSFSSLGQTFVGKYAEDLGQLIGDQIKPIYEKIGVVIPVKSCSIVHALKAMGCATLTELAKALQQSHQLIKQKIPKLLALDLITVEQDEGDKRRMIYSLTDLGHAQAQLLRDHSMKAVYQNLSEEINADIYEVLHAALNSLKEKDLFTRFIETTDNNGNEP